MQPADVVGQAPVDARPPSRLDPVRTSRVAAAAGGSAVAVGTVIMLVALVAAPGPWTDGYVSEAGTVGLPLSWVYRCGLVLLAAGVSLIGAAVSRAARLAAALLGGAGVLAGASGAVPCSPGCPLPPYQPTTVADLLHTAASILGMAVIAVAMVAVAISPALVGAQRRLAACAAGLTFPLGTVIGLAMLLIGRGPLVAVLERLLLAVAICWLLGTAGLLAARRQRPRVSG